MAFLSNNKMLLFALGLLLLYCMTNGKLSLFEKMEGETECNDEDEDCSVEKLSHEDHEDHEVQANSDDSNLGASLEAVEKEEEEEEKKPEGFESVANDNLEVVDLLPKDVDTLSKSKYSNVNESWNIPNQSLDQMNFLDTQKLNLNMVSSSLRNPSLDLRSEPPNPQNLVSPWNNTTVAPNACNRTFEIGSSKCF